MSNKSKKNGAARPGRPEVSVKPPRAGSKFTVATLQQLNPEIKAELTLRNRVTKWIKQGLVKKTKETKETGKAGKPARIFLYVGGTAGANKTPRKSKSSETVTVTSPSVSVVDATPAPAPEATPAVETAPVAAPSTDDTLVNA